MLRINTFHFALQHISIVSDGLEIPEICVCTSLTVYCELIHKKGNTIMQSAL
jgi:hypothetical protein